MVEKPTNGKKRKSYRTNLRSNSKRKKKNTWLNDWNWKTANLMKKN